MHIVHILDKGPGEGGIAAHVAALQPLLATMGHRSSCLQVVPPSADAATRAAGLPRTFNPVTAARHVPRLLRRLGELRPDVVHLHAGFTTFSPVLVRVLRRRLPVVGTFHDVRPLCYRGTRRFRDSAELCTRVCGADCHRSGCVPRAAGPAGLRQAARAGVERWLLAEWRALAGVLVPSTYLRDLCLAHGFDAGRLQVVSHFTAVGTPRAAAAGTPELVFVGSLLPHKGAEDFVAALALLARREWTAHLVGDGPLRDAVREQLAAAGIAGRVTMHGHLAAPARDRLLARARLLAFPSRLPEGFGLVGIEALAQGAPVVSYGAGGIGEWLRHGENGLQVPLDDVGALAGAMARLLDDPALALRLGEAGRRQVAERFTAERCGRALEQAYNAGRVGFRPQGVAA